MSSDSEELEPVTSRRVFADPCRIGVIADTHIYAGGKRKIPAGVMRLFERAELDIVVHLGDANVRKVLEELAAIAPLIAVPGNNDDLAMHSMLPETVRFQVENRSFGVLHGHGGRTARSEAERRFAGKVDCVLFGHSHQPLIDRVDDTILFNPGSATDRRWSEYFGVGLIDVYRGEISPELILYLDADHLDNVDVSPRHYSKRNQGTR